MLALSPDGAASNILETGGARSGRHPHSVSRLRLVGIVRTHLGGAAELVLRLALHFTVASCRGAHGPGRSSLHRLNVPPSVNSWGCGGDRSSVNHRTTRGVTDDIVLVRVPRYSVFLDCHRTSQCAGAIWTANHESLDCQRRR